MHKTVIYFEINVETCGALFQPDIQDNIQLVATSNKDTVARMEKGSQ